MSAAHTSPGLLWNGEETAESPCQRAREACSHPVRSSLEATKRTLHYSLYLGQTGRLPKYLPQRPRTSKRSLLFTISSSIKEDEPLRTEEGQRLNNGRHPLTSCMLTQPTGFKQTPSTWLRFSSLTVTILMTSSGASPVYTQFCPIQPTPQRPRRHSQPCRLCIATLGVRLTAGLFIL